MLIVRTDKQQQSASHRSTAALPPGPDRSIRSSIRGAITVTERIRSAPSTATDLPFSESRLPPHPLPTHPHALLPEYLREYRRLRMVPFGSGGLGLRRLC